MAVFYAIITGMGTLYDSNNDKLTDAQKAQALKDFDAVQRHRTRIGQIIIFIIAGINVIDIISSAIINFNLFNLIIKLALTIALLCGVNWVRYFFAIGTALGALISLSMLLPAATVVPGYITVILLINFAVSTASSVLLFTSKCVHEFLYAQKNG